MDLMSIMSAMMGGSSTTGISKATGTQSADVTSILASALPTLLQGAGKQAQDTSTASSFAQALQYHAADDTSNLSNFYKNVDLDDGAKIVKHLFGSNTNAAIKSIASDAGVTQNQAASVLSAAAPLMMSLLGQQTAAETRKATTQAQQTSATSSLMSSLLSNVDIGSIASSLLSSAVSTNTSTKKTTTKASTKKSSGVDLSDGLDVGDVVGILGKILK